MTNIELLDPRVNAIREDLADYSLKEHAGYRKLVQPKLAQIVDPIAPLRSSPRFDASLDSQALYGEKVKVYDETEGWSWVQLEKDGYVGNVPSENLSFNICNPTHRVTVLQTFIYPEPNIKTPPLQFLPMNSTLEVVDELGEFVQIASGGFVYSAHVVPVGEYSSDFVEVAQKFIGVPYLWGGRTSQGIDCSGLVQMSLHAAGVEAPRDSDMLEEQLGTFIGEDAYSISLQRGDLVFWKGHVGIMIDERNLLHANGYHMLTVKEPVQEAVCRIADMYGVVKSVKRL